MGSWFGYIYIIDTFLFLAKVVYY